MTILSGQVDYQCFCSDRHKKSISQTDALKNRVTLVRKGCNRHHPGSFGVYFRLTGKQNAFSPY